jgi:hypothetical protein
LASLRISCGHDIGAAIEGEILSSVSSFYAATNPDKLSDISMSKIKVVKEFNAFTPLKVPVPPMLAKAMGYKGDARFVSFQWTPYGDEADYSDGRISATGNWQAFLYPTPGRQPFF